MGLKRCGMVLTPTEKRENARGNPRERNEIIGCVWERKSDNDITSY